MELLEPSYVGSQRVIVLVPLVPLRVELVSVCARKIGSTTLKPIRRFRPEIPFVFGRIRPKAGILRLRRSFPRVFAELVR